MEEVVNIPIRWHSLAFRHSCGLVGTVLDICASSDGGIVIEGLCVPCGVEFRVEDTFADLIAKCAIQDYIRHKAEIPSEILENFTPSGKPS